MLFTWDFHKQWDNSKINTAWFPSQTLTNASISSPFLATQQGIQHGGRLMNIVAPSRPFKSKITRIASASGPVQSVQWKPLHGKMIPKRQAWFQLLRDLYRCSHFGQWYLERPHAPPNDSPLWWIIKGFEMQTRRLSMKLIFWSSNPNRKKHVQKFQRNLDLLFFRIDFTSRASLVSQPRCGYQEMYSVQ